VFVPEGFPDGIGDGRPELESTEFCDLFLKKDGMIRTSAREAVCRESGGARVGEEERRRQLGTRSADDQGATPAVINSASSRVVKASKRALYGADA
jgi:hypothetical protein